jgi:hypothetical protein
MTPEPETVALNPTLRGASCSLDKVAQRCASFAWSAPNFRSAHSGQ